MGKYEKLYLKLVGLPGLENFKKKHADVRGSIDAWIKEILAAKWKSPQCIKNRYRSVDFLGDNKIIFDIKGNKYRIVVKVDYEREIVLIQWVGTHAEYNKKKF